MWKTVQLIGPIVLPALDILRKAPVMLNVSDSYNTCFQVATFVGGALELVADWSDFTSNSEVILLWEEPNHRQALHKIVDIISCF